MKTKIIVTVVIISSLLFIVTGCFKRTVIPGNGSVSPDTLANDGLVELSGPWELYLGKFYIGDDFKGEAASGNRRYVNLETSWNNIFSSGFRIPEKGFATFRLCISLTDKPEEKILIRIPNSDLALNIYCNNLLVFSNGKAGKTTETSEVVKYYPYVSEVVPQNGLLELVIHASNFHFIRGGMREPFMLGYSTTLNSFVEIMTAIEMILIGWLLIMCLYNIILYFVLQKGGLHLYFAIVCLAASLHSMAAGSSLFGRLGMTWDHLLTIRYLSWLIAVYFYYRFFTTIFREYGRKSITYGYTAIAIICICIIFFMPYSGYHYIYYTITLLYLFSIIYFFAAAFHAFVKKRENSGLLLVSFILLFPIMLSDIIFPLSMNRFNIVSPAEIVLFCIIQSIIIGKDINVQFKKNRELAGALQKSNAELTILNKHLEIMVAEKTDELKRQNMEISEQNRQIMDMNFNLEERVKASVEDLRQRDDMLTINARQAALGEMLGFIGHQWKQNIYAISLYTEAIKNLIDQKGELDINAAKESLDKIDSFVIAMFNTFNNFNNFIKPAGDSEIFSISGAVDDTILLMYDFITINSVNIIKYYNGDPALDGLSNELEQVIMNLIKNSIDAFNERNITERKIFISVSRRDGMNYLSIRDNAGGIQMDNPDDVFDKFYTSKKTGTGLGLYIARIVIEQRFNGKIEVSNIENGAEFKISIPVFTEDAVL